MKISLENLENSRLKLSEKDMEHLRGGGDGVRCGCLYAGTPGGASTADNKAANEAGSLWTVPPTGSGSDSSGSDRYNHVEPAVSTYVKPPVDTTPIPRKP